MLIQDPLFWGLAVISLLMPARSLVASVEAWGWVMFPSQQRNPSQSSAGHYAALPNHHGYQWMVRLARLVGWGSVEAAITSSCPWCMPRGIGLSCVIG